MKKYFLLLLIPLCFKAHSQVIDSTALKIAQLKEGIIYMRNNLDRCHGEYSTGTILIVIGIVAEGVGVATIPSTTSYYYNGTNNTSLSTALIVSGSILTLLGTIVTIDSHRFIGRAGRWRFKGTSIEMAL